MENTTKAVIAVTIIVVLALGVYATSVLYPGSSTSASSSSSSTSSSSHVDVNVGFFLNINHAPALLGYSSGAFQDALGPSMTIHRLLFTQGGPEMIALLAGQIDIGYVGPSPSVNAYTQSGGTGLKILAGVTSGGAVLVVQGDSAIENASDLAGKTIGSPGLGNTQDVALRYYLMDHGYSPCSQAGCGSVTVQASSNSAVVLAFAQHQIDGAWVPEPYGEVLMQQYGGRLFLDERSLWPGGNFSTAVLVVRTQFLEQHPDIVRAFVAADVAETIWINQHPAEALTNLNATLSAELQQVFAPNVLNASLNRLAFTYDPLKTSVATQAEHAYQLGFLTQEPTDLSGLYDLSILNSVLTERGLPTIQ